MAANRRIDNRAAKKGMVGELERVASHLEKHGLVNAARILDKVSNTIEAAVPDTEPGNITDQAAHMDAFQASPSDYHSPMPVGINNLSQEVTGMSNAAGANPEFATDHEIDILAARSRNAESTDLRDLTSFPLNNAVFDLGSPEGGIATTDLPESGGPGSEALDDNQVGQPIPPMRTRPAGSVHAALRQKKAALVQAVKMNIMSTAQAKSNWAKILEANNISARRDPFSPPSVVPPQARGIWAYAVRKVKQAGKLYTAGKQPNRPAVIKAYRDVLVTLAEAME